MLETFIDRNGEEDYFVPFFGFKYEGPSDKVYTPVQLPARQANILKSRRDELRIKLGGLVAGIAVLTGTYAFMHFSNEPTARTDKRIEECVEDRVGYDVTITRDPGRGNIIRPKEIAHDIVACSN